MADAEASGAVSRPLGIRSRASSPPAMARTNAMIVTSWTTMRCGRSRPATHRPLRSTRAPAVRTNQARGRPGRGTVRLTAAPRCPGAPGRTAGPDDVRARGRGGPQALDRLVGVEEGAVGGAHLGQQVELVGDADDEGGSTPSVARSVTQHLAVARDGVEGPGQEADAPQHLDAAGRVVLERPDTGADADAAAPDRSAGWSGRGRGASRPPGCRRPPARAAPRCSAIAALRSATRALWPARCGALASTEATSTSRVCSWALASSAYCAYAQRATNSGARTSTTLAGPSPAGSQSTTMRKATTP